MAIIHTSGTQLDYRPRKPLSNLMLWMVGLLLVLSLCPSLLHSDVNSPIARYINWDLTTWLVGFLCIGTGLYSSYITHQFLIRKLHVIFLISACLITIPLFFPQANVEYSMYKILAIWFGGLYLLSLQQVQWNARKQDQLIGLICIIGLLCISYHYALYLELFPTNNLPKKNLHPEILNSLLPMTLVLCAYLIVQNKRYIWLKFALGFTPILIIPIVFLINTFIIWFTLFACILLIQPYLFRHLSLDRWLHWFCCLLLGFSIGVFLGASEANFWQSLYTNISGHHWKLLFQMKDMLLEQPILGYGYGEFKSAYNAYVDYQIYWDPTYPTAIIDIIQPWNEWLYWWIEGGLLALAGLLAVLVFCLYQLTKVALAKRLLLVAIFLPQFIQATLTTPFYHTNFHWFLLIILIYWFNQQTKSK